MTSAPRTPDEISAEIAQTRNRLAGTIDQLVYRAKPQTIVQRQIATTKASFYDERGSLRTDKVAIVVGAVVGAVAVVIAIRKIVG